MKITMQNKFKKTVTYNIEYEEIISSEDYGMNIKIGTPLYVFYINRIDKEFKQEAVQVMEEYVDILGGIDNYINNSINNWSSNYENDLRKQEWNMEKYTQQEIDRIPSILKCRWNEEWIKEDKKPIDYLGRLAIIKKGKNLSDNRWITEGVDFIIVD